MYSLKTLNTMSNNVTSKRSLLKKLIVLAPLTLLIFIAGCRPEEDDDDDTDNTYELSFYAEGHSSTENSIEIYEGDSIRFISEFSTPYVNWHYWALPGVIPDTLDYEFFGPSNYSPYVKYLTAGVYDVRHYVAHGESGGTENKVSSSRLGYIVVLADTTPPPSCGTTVTDIDGNVYDVVEIGSQCWMQENLKTATYNDGTPIPTGLTDGEWDIATTGAYAIYQDNSANDDIHGKLYNWYAVETGKLCPQGWHIPTKAEFETLINFVGGSSQGGALKSTNLWDVPNVGATNSSGFTALASGSRLETFWGYFGLGSDAHFWSTTEGLDGGAEHMLLSTYETDVLVESYPKLNGFSCRCVKD